MGGVETVVRRATGRGRGDGHDARVRKMSKQLAAMSFPATDRSVARMLGILKPQFCVNVRACSFSFFPEFPSTTTTYESCRLNKDYELVVVRKTSFHPTGTTETQEWSADIRRVKQSHMKPNNSE